jgi:hypothetical protein
MALQLYWCETWSLIVREEYKLRVFENRVVRRIFGPKRDEEWRLLGCYAAWILKEPRFRRNLAPPSSG